MNRQTLINDAVNKISKLPDIKLQEINDFADFLLSRIDDKIIIENIQDITSKSKSFDFLNDEEELYDESDLKEKFK